MMIKRIAIVFGIIFVVVGILGFIPGISPIHEDTGHRHLLGVFAVDTLHNLVHIATGLIAIACGVASETASRTYFKVFGIIYGIVALLGFAYGKMPLLGIMANNLPDAALHTVIAVVALFLGFAHLPARFGHHEPGTHHPA